MSSSKPTLIVFLDLVKTPCFVCICFSFFSAVWVAYSNEQSRACMYTTNKKKKKKRERERDGEKRGMGEEREREREGGGGRVSE